jgi:hypothetical protein
VRFNKRTTIPVELRLLELPNGRPDTAIAKDALAFACALALIAVVRDVACSPFRIVAWNCDDIRALT